MELSRDVYLRVTETMIHRYISGPGRLYSQQKSKWKLRLIPEARFLIEWLRLRHSSLLFPFHSLPPPPAPHHPSPPPYLPIIRSSEAQRVRGIWYLKSSIFLKAHEEEEQVAKRIAKRDKSWGLSWIRCAQQKGMGTEREINEHEKIKVRGWTQEG